MNKEKVHKEIITKLNQRHRSERKELENKYFEILTDEIIKESKDKLIGLTLWGSVREKELFIVSKMNSRDRRYGTLPIENIDKLSEYYVKAYITNDLTNEDLKIWI